jgi:hypothetical protein
MSEIAEHFHAVEREIEAAKARRRAGVDEPVGLIAVTKNHGVEAMREAIDAGAAIIGENRVQEAAQKKETLERNVSWHLIGHLQTNKAKQAVRLFDLIHSVDSEHLLAAVNEAAQKIHKVQDILIQVNLAKEDSKFGIYKEDLPILVQKADMMKNVHLMGLMCIAPNYEDVEECRPLFRGMREIFDRLRDFPLFSSEMKYLSMGMTHDYRIAVEEGANLVRVGTAIFGARQYK